MAELVIQLASKEPHYIRCIKPNEEKSSVAFDLERVQHQVLFYIGNKAFLISLLLHITSKCLAFLKII